MIRIADMSSTSSTPSLSSPHSLPRRIVRWPDEQRSVTSECVEVVEKGIPTYAVGCA